MRKLLCVLLFSSIFLHLTSFALAEDNPKTEEILKKLDDISSKQKEILAQLDTMKQELYVIKIRATKK